MQMTLKPDDQDILVTIQNSSKPEQVIYLVVDRPNGQFETRGLKELFNLKEIRLESQDVLVALPEYAQVLSFLLNTMSTAQDLNLPYYYQDEFEYGGVRYSLKDMGNYRVLKRVEDNAGPMG